MSTPSEYSEAFRDKVVAFYLTHKGQYTRQQVCDKFGVEDYNLQMWLRSSRRKAPDFLQTVENRKNDNKETLQRLALRIYTNIELLCQIHGKDFGELLQKHSLGWANRKKSISRIANAYKKTPGDIQRAAEEFGMTAKDLLLPEQTALLHNRIVEARIREGINKIREMEEKKDIPSPKSDPTPKGNKRN